MFSRAVQSISFQNIYVDAFKPYTDREKRSLDEIIILKRNQTEIFINLIYVLFSPEACYNENYTPWPGSPVPGNWKHVS